MGNVFILKERMVSASLRSLLGLLILGVPLLANAAEPSLKPFDILIRNALVVDGTGAEASRADVAIDEEHINRLIPGFTYL